MVLPKLTPEEKLAALSAAEPITTSDILKKESGGRPWLLADKKNKVSYPARLDGDVAAKLEFIYQNAQGRPSKNSLINQAIELFADKWLEDNKYI